MNFYANTALWWRITGIHQSIMTQLETKYPIFFPQCRRQESLKNIQDPYKSQGRIQGELQWCQETTCQIIEIMFDMCQTHWDTMKLLQLLAEAHFGQIISRSGNIYYGIFHSVLEDERKRKYYDQLWFNVC